MVTSVGSNLLDRLIEYQRYWRLSDYKFAEKLSVSSQLWQMTRTGKRDIGLSVLKGIMRAYPELEQDVLFFLRGDVDKGTMMVETPTDHYQNSQNQNPGVFRRVFKRVFNRPLTKQGKGVEEQ